MSAKFTPGPWSIRTEFGKLCIRPGDYNAKGYSSGYAPIAKVAGDERINNDEANARLIAAAPELLEACKRMMLWFEVEDDHSKMPEFMHRVDLCNQVEMLASAAIAKATGDPQ